MITYTHIVWITSADGRHKLALLVVEEMIELPLEWPAQGL